MTVSSSVATPIFLGTGSGLDGFFLAFSSASYFAFASFSAYFLAFSASSLALAASFSDNFLAAA
jgi:hypothetical protein